MTHPPRVTIITVVFNSRDLLARTIASVDTLVYPNIEHVIVDGGSTDGTTELLSVQRDVTVCGVSEQDAGIYDAMNKGLHLATGDYIWFLNAGDTPAARDVLQPLHHADNPDVLYGDTNLVSNEYALVKVAYAPSSLSWQKMTWGMYISHQSIVVRRNLAPKYDLSYRLIADQKWIVEVLRRARSVKYLGRPMSNYLLGGVSQRFYLKCLLEKIRYSFSIRPSIIAFAIALFGLLSAVRFYAGQLLRRIKSNL